MKTSAIVALLMCWLLWAGVASAQDDDAPTAPPTPQEQYETGVMAYWRADDDIALAALNAAIEADPDFADAYAYRGALYRALGRYAEARADFDQALALMPDSALAYALRSRLWLNISDDYARAFADANRARQLAPQSSIVYTSRAILYLTRGEYHKAIADYDIAIQFAPDFAPNYNNRGLAYEFLGDYDAAIADYERAAQLDTAYFAPLQNLAFTYIELRQFTNALASFTRAIDIRPDNAELYFRRGRIYELLGDLDRAEADYIVAEELGYPVTRLNPAGQTYHTKDIAS